MAVSGDLKLHQYRRFENEHFLLKIQREKNGLLVRFIRISCDGKEL